MFLKLVSPLKKLDSIKHSRLQKRTPALKAVFVKMLYYSNMKKNMEIRRAFMEVKAHSIKKEVALVVVKIINTVKIEIRVEVEVVKVAKKIVIDPTKMINQIKAKAKVKVRVEIQGEEC